MSQLVSRPTGGAITDAEQKPLITAILVTRNKEAYLRECLCGLMEQTMADRMEVIVVDQGSEQSEVSIIADLQRRYPNLISLRTAAGKGTCAGLNLALKIASGRYLTTIEATDRLRDDAYELLATALDAAPEAMLAYGNTCFTAVPHESFDHHTSYGKMIWPDYTAQQLTQQSLVAPHLMWRRVLNDSIGGFDEGSQSQGIRGFLLRTIARFRLVHIEEFTGLQLIAAGSPLNVETPVQAPCLKQNLQVAARQPVAHPTALQLCEPASPAVSAALPKFSEPAPRTVAAPTVTAAPAPCRVPAPAPDADAAYTRVQELVSGGSDRQAADALASHLERYPEHALAHNDLAAFSFRLGDTQAALSHYRTAVQLCPGENTFQKNLADLCFVEGQIDEAIGIYLNLLKSSPRDTETLLNIGIISESVGQPDEAESFYQRALEIEPWNQSVRQRITELRLSLAQPAPEEDLESPEDLYEKAQEWVAQGDLAAAASELQGILDHFPDFPLAHNDLAVICYQNGDKDQAQAHYEKAAALAPGNSIFQKNLADFYFVEGRDIDGAIAIYLKLLQKEPRNVETLMNLGRICTMLDRPEEAKSFYGKVTQLEPWNRDARECLTSLRQCVNG